MAAAHEHEHSRRPAVRVVDTVLVHPSPPSSETSLPLTFYDVFWLRTLPVQRVFFYRLDASADIDVILSSLRDSLSQAISVFFPLAGRLRLAPGTTNRYELHYRLGDAVAFTVADSNDDLDNLAADEPREAAKLAALAPPLPEGGAVLALQATTLNARGCIALGVTAHHAACDGAGSTHFLRTWAAFCAGVQPSPEPVMDRTLISDPTGLYDFICPKDEEVNKSLKILPVDEQLLFGTFVLSRAHLQRVKDLAAASHHGSPRCSSLVATLGLVWSCHQRATNKPGGSSGKTKTCLAFPVDHRSRLSPPVPDTYLGNCIGGAIAIASRAELAAAGAGGLLTACAAVAAAVEEATRDLQVLGACELWRERVVEAAGMSVLSVAGSPRFGMYGLDFGFGRPAKVDIVSVARIGGAVAVAESRVGDGGMEVGLALPPDGMDAFRRCFDDAVAGLDVDAGPQ
ncbi:hypothetical protein PR202_ga24675 [Eleusine coracana subsp. coracana]|uniref:Uncharacterized protein n=1 Tax=Eleusine coracana subsp. coracana TaxID=191504 RepID=A0AAV5D8Z8_ELECO|nr:hypothetical protein QOZ80_9AG0676040 [Eleusine coracana subsp. coracana]GJN06901.1 hypothetical protein PR202_ga24675 [Eleusine coracana subsp. coracana]